MTRVWTAFSFVVAGLVVATLAGGSGGVSRASVAANPPMNTAAPSIGGVARRGQTLSASTGSWSGATPISFGYNWQRCDTHGAGCATIGGATGSTYVLTSSEVGKTVRVLVTATNSDGIAQALSAPSGVVADLGDVPVNKRQPNPSGTAQEGQTIKVDKGDWKGTKPFTYAYQWQRCTAQHPVCTTIAGATSNTYLVTGADVGFRLRAQVVATNVAGQGVTFSNLTDVVVARAAAPANTALPTITGTPAVGRTLAASSGSWAGASGSFRYQWLRCNSGGGACKNIGGATHQTYTLVAADAGSTVRVAVTASNKAGSTTATSNAVFVPGTPPPSGGGAIDLGRGVTSVPVSGLVAHPDRLRISQMKLSPQPFGTRFGIFTARFRVMVEGTNHVVRGALVTVVGIPYGWIVKQPERATGVDGWVTFRIQTTAKM